MLQRYYCKVGPLGPFIDEDLLSAPLSPVGRPRGLSTDPPAVPNSRSLECPGSEKGVHKHETVPEDVETVEDMSRMKFSSEWW